MQYSFTEVIKLSDVRTADALLEMFCKHVENYVVVNTALLDFSPAHSSWCFSFERYNGKLGSLNVIMASWGQF